MATVEVEVNGRPYLLACEDGQESRLRELAAYVDHRLKGLTGGGRSGAEAQMLVITCLVLADELQDVIAGRDVLAGRGLVAHHPGLAPEEAEDLTASVNDLAERIEEVAARLERA
ncbi:cell division protein ZapA [Azospirillum sp. RWY-5-1]|uniref:Cell division protein ZapA n=1 Tax=Azospirillum oleiclasticum TaxID=2735135 RepID=A0ABX2TE05_9PROT|nr:cell division protein ZapA [Azospirillum oleiclasticum]NYZ15320.1 cell division protein ZapA [Azospirillum oleiclasticum]NYZ21259.1 cell division protein ZapA [Azospirillum oleiclasticum]